jgi:hypothetical protein
VSPSKGALFIITNFSKVTFAFGKFLNKLKSASKGNLCDFGIDGLGNFCFDLVLKNIGAANKVMIKRRIKLNNFKNFL